MAAYIVKKKKGEHGNTELSCFLSTMQTTGQGSFIHPPGFKEAQYSSICGNSITTLRNRVVEEFYKDSCQLIS